MEANGRWILLFASLLRYFQRPFWLEKHKNNCKRLLFTNLFRNFAFKLQDNEESNNHIGTD